MFGMSIMLFIGGCIVIGGVAYWLYFYPKQLKEDNKLLEIPSVPTPFECGESCDCGKENLSFAPTREETAKRISDSFKFVPKKEDTKKPVKDKTKTPEKAIENYWIKKKKKKSKAKNKTKTKTVSKEAKKNG